jgi:hypothetical protein
VPACCSGGARSSSNAGAATLAAAAAAVRERQHDRPQPEDLIKLFTLYLPLTGE